MLMRFLKKLYFEITSNLQKSCKNHSQSYHTRYSDLAISNIVPHWFFSLLSVSTNINTHKLFFPISLNLHISCLLPLIIQCVLPKRKDKGVSSQTKETTQNFRCIEMVQDFFLYFQLCFDLQFSLRCSPMLELDF